MKLYVVTQFVVSPVRDRDSAQANEQEDQDEEQRLVESEANDMSAYVDIDLVHFAEIKLAQTYEYYEEYEV